MHLRKIIGPSALITQTPCELRNNPSCPSAAEQKGPWMEEEHLHFPHRIHLACKWAWLLPMPAFASGTWDSPDLFDVALFKHSDHPVKLRLMDRACHSERPRQRGDNLVTRTHLSFVVERDIVCTGALVSAVLTQALCEPQCSQGCHLGLNNPRCHYLGYLSIPPSPLWPNNTQTVEAGGACTYACVCSMLCDIMCLCDCVNTVDCLFPYGEGLMHSCTCPLNGIPSMENNRWGEVALGQGVAETDNVFRCITYLFMPKMLLIFLKMFSIPCFILIFSHFFSFKTRSSLLVYCDFVNLISVFYTRTKYIHTFK